MENQKKNKAYYAKLEGWLSIFINIFLFGIKYWAGVVTGSIALIADAWHTLSDTISSVVILVGVKVSHKPADSEHPFGHGRAELISTLIVGMILAFIAFEFFIEGFQRIRMGEQVTYGKIAILVTVLSIVVKEAIAQVAFYLGKKSDSDAVKADAWHHRSDALSSLVILVGIFLSKYIVWIDGALAILVSLMIAKTTYSIINKTATKILGDNHTYEESEKLTKIVNETAGFNTNIHHIHIHKYGEHYEATFHIRLPKEMRIDEAHDITACIENDVYEKLGMVSTIHIEPRRSNQTLLQSTSANRK